MTALPNLKSYHRSQSSSYSSSEGWMSKWIWCSCCLCHGMVWRPSCWALGAHPGTVFPLVGPSLEQGPWLNTWSSGLSDVWHLIFSLRKNRLLCINSITRRILCSVWQPRKILQGYLKGWDGFRRQCWLCVNIRGRVIAQVLAVVGDKTALSIAYGSASTGLFLTLILYAD